MRILIVEDEEKLAGIIARRNLGRAMNIYYASRDGQSHRIATHIGARLADRGIDNQPRNLAAGLPAAEDLAGSPLVVLIAAVRYGRHLPEADALLATYRSLAAPPPLVLLSVNLTARKTGKNSAEGNAYLRKWILRHRLAPAFAEAIAGRLDYPRYGWFDRQMIRFIMLLTGGPTDPRTRIEYTAWPRVDEIAGQIALLHAAAGR